MTTRYLTTDQNGNGSQTYWDINGYFLHGPSGEKLNLGGGNSLVTASNEIVQIGTSYIRVPQGVSNERPSPSYAGMIRYLTTENLLEYFNGQTNTWLPISLPSPTLSSISPNYINYDASGTNTNTYTLTGSNFNNEPGGISVEVIGNNGTGTILIPNFNNVSSETSATFTFDPSGTEQLIGISNELPFAVKLTNTNSGFSSILTNAIIATNAGPEFTQPSVFTPSSFQTFAVQDPCANFIVGGIDLISPTHYPLTFSFVSGTAGGFNVGGGDISSISDFSSIVQVPSGNRLSATAGSYNFKMRVTDASHASSDTNYTLSLANPTITSIDPSFITISDVVDINITGNYFIRDTDISFNKGGNTLTQSEVSYNSITSLTVKDVSAGEAGVYDISLANGSVIVNVPSIVLNILRPVIFTTSSLTVDPPIYFDQGGSVIGGPTLLGETLIYIKASTSGNITFSNITTSINCKALIVGGGGPGGFGHGGGGAGGAVLYRTNQSITATSYLVTIGAGGVAEGNGDNNPGGSSSMFGVTATGGGAGANEIGNDTSGRGGIGGNGANGGGGSYTRNGGTGTAPTASGWTVYGGNNGGNGASTTAVPYGCGGGGGAGGAGQSSTSIANQGGAGANGIQIDIDGNNYYWGAGGGGVTFSLGEPPATQGISGNGGLGGGGGGCAVGGTPGTGGGSALNSGGNGVNGAETRGGAGGANTGSGGGGGANEDGPGGQGGSGIVIIRFPSFTLN
jgi:hypothetical protein|uniref:Uncharacterized protein n=1 Tax=viral metagenome TaxID=1070528 RepID=A0A6C0CVT2_9ZZZZ